jgi:CRP-like cAMP-binding protein
VRYSATALMNSNVCFIEKKTIIELLKKNGNFAYEMMLIICDDDLNCISRFVNQLQKNINGKIAEALLYFADTIYQSDEFEMPLSRDDFGKLVSTSREAVSRTLSKFHENGLIEISGHYIKILNKSKIEKISEVGH